MFYDEALEKRLHSVFSNRADVEAKRMFGGLCFMISNHMCCGIVGNTLVARMGPERYAECLSEAHVREMDFTGRALKGMVSVSPEGIKNDADLKKWVDRCRKFTSSLHQKTSK